MIDGLHVATARSQGILKRSVTSWQKKFAHIGHLKVDCFQITGVVPDWCKAMRDSIKGKPVAGALDITGSNKPPNNDTSSALSVAEAKIAKLEGLIMNKTQGGTSLNTPIDFAGGVFEMAGGSSSSHYLSNQWLLDSGASCHLCANFSLLTEL